MTHALTWRPACSQDIPELQQFCCTEDRRRHHPEPWALVAQGMVRNLRPASKRNRYVLIGRDAEGIGAALSYRFEDGGAFIMLEVLAVALRLARQRIGDSAMDCFVDSATQTALERDLRSIVIQAKVDHRNHRSIALVTRWGFRYRWRSGNYKVFEAEHPLSYIEPPPAG